MENNVDLELSLFKNPKGKFKEHLQLPNNERIIFSGKFGHGKTTFLKHFFEDETQLSVFGRETPYNVISLYPVNYSIASNEDIFKYIKYDIILEMLARNYEIEDAVISYKETLPTYLRKNWLKVVTTIVSMVPKVGKDVIESFDKVNNLKEEFFKFHDDQNLEQNKGDQFSNFLEEIQKTQGSIFEEDLITKLIEEVLNDKLKKDSKKENVLIIDDLDRIDPEHIFRLLNVFAAHFDRRQNSKNKFGFDKIILVCDIENIRNIFAAKYGLSTDFNGYIDKFYSNEIFHYGNRQDFERFARKIFNNVVVLGPVNRDSWDADNYKRTLFGGDSKFFVDMLLLLFDNKQIGLRNILKYKDTPFKIRGSHVFFENLRIQEGDFNILPVLRFLAVIKGDHKGLKTAFSDAKITSLSPSIVQKYCRELIYILTFSEHKNRQQADGNTWVYQVMEYTFNIKYFGDNKSETQISTVNGQSYIFNLGHLKHLLNETIDFLEMHNYI